MKAFKISFRSAERIKNLHGGAISTGRDDRDLIDIERGFDVNFDDRITISRSELIGVIRPRIEEILEEVKEHLDVAGFRYLQGQRIVLTGGASQLPGLFDIALSIFGSSIRIGKPIRVQGLPHATNGPEFASAIGLALHSASPQDECWDFNISFSKSRLASTNRLFKWFSENW